MMLKKLTNFIHGDRILSQKEVLHALFDVFSRTDRERSRILTILKKTIETTESDILKTFDSNEVIIFEIFNSPFWGTAEMDKQLREKKIEQKLQENLLSLNANSISERLYKKNLLTGRSNWSLYAMYMVLALLKRSIKLSSVISSNEYAFYGQKTTYEKAMATFYEVSGFIHNHDTGIKLTKKQLIQNAVNRYKLRQAKEEKIPLIIDLFLKEHYNLLVSSINNSFDIDNIFSELDRRKKELITKYKLNNSGKLSVFADNKIPIGKRILKEKDKIINESFERIVNEALIDVEDSKNNLVFGQSFILYYSYKVTILQDNIDAIVVNEIMRGIEQEIIDKISESKYKKIAIEEDLGTQEVLDITWIQDMVESLLVKDNQELIRYLTRMYKSPKRTWSLNHIISLVPGINTDDFDIIKECAEGYNITIYHKDNETDSKENSIKKEKKSQESNELFKEEKEIVFEEIADEESLSRFLKDRNVVGPKSNDIVAKIMKYKLNNSKLQKALWAYINKIHYPALIRKRGLYTVFRIGSNRIVLYKDKILDICTHKEYEEKWFSTFHK